MSFAATVREERRGTVLRILVDQSGYGANDGVLQTVLEGFGFRESRDTIKSDLAWLQEQGLVQVTEVSTVWVAVITQRGDDVASGRATVPGVRRARPVA